MNPDLDPTNVGKSNSPVVQSVTPVQQTENVQPVKPKTLPAILDSFVKPDTIGGDLCRYFIFPAIETGLHKVFSAIIGHYILGQPIKPANQKSNGIYIYADNNGSTDYTKYSGSKTTATVVNPNGASRTISNEKYTGNNMRIFRLQHFDDNDIIHANPLVWTDVDAENKQYYLLDVLGDIAQDTGGVTVQDLCDALGMPAPATANLWWWTNISKLSVFVSPSDRTVLVVDMGMEASEWKKDQKER